MVGIRLFDAATRESTSRMDFGLVMQSAESVLDKFEQLVKENESLDDITYPEGEVMVETALDGYEDGYDEHMKIARDGINSVNALQDTSMLIAPEIQESSRKDIALVRQVATTAAAGMGIDPAHLLPAGMDNNVGKPMSLNMEGFIKQAIVAIRAIWRVIITICEYAIGMFKMHFSMMAARLRRIVHRLGKLDSLKHKPAPEVIKITGEWWLLTKDGTYPTEAAAITAMVNDFQSLLRDFVGMKHGGEKAWREMSGMFSGMPKEIPVVYQRTMKEAGEFLNDLTIEKTFVKAENDCQSVASLGGGHIVIRNGALVPNKFSSPIEIGAKIINTQADWVNGTPAAKPANLPGITPVELVAVLREYLGVFESKKNVNLLDKMVHMAAADTRNATAMVKSWSKDVDKLLDDGIGDEQSAMLTEMTALARVLITYRFGAFAKFTRVAGDTVSAMQTYMDAHIDAMK